MKHKETTYFMADIIFRADNSYEYVYFSWFIGDDPNQLFAYYSHTEGVLNEEALSH